MGGPCPDWRHIQRLHPAICAMSLGIVGIAAFDARQGRNQTFNFGRERDRPLCLMGPFFHARTPITNGKRVTTPEKRQQDHVSHGHDILNRLGGARLVRACIDKGDWRDRSWKPCVVGWCGCAGTALLTRAGPMIRLCEPSCSAPTMNEAAWRTLAGAARVGCDDWAPDRLPRAAGRQPNESSPEACKAAAAGCGRRPSLVRGGMACSTTFTLIEDRFAPARRHLPQATAGVARLSVAHWWGFPRVYTSRSKTISAPGHERVESRGPDGSWRPYQTAEPPSSWANWGHSNHVAPGLSIENLRVWVRGVPPRGSEREPSGQSWQQQMAAGGQRKIRRA